MMISSSDELSLGRIDPAYTRYAAMNFHERKAYRIAHGGPPPRRRDPRNLFGGVGKNRPSFAIRVSA